MYRKQIAAVLAIFAVFSLLYGCKTQSVTPTESTGNGQTQATVPEKTQPTEPNSTEATAPTVPETQPVSPTQPVPPTQPTEQTQPTEATNPTTSETQPTAPNTTTPLVQPTEPTKPQETTGGNGTGGDSSQMTYERYNAMSGAEQMAFFNTFATTEDFFVWYNAAKAKYEAEHPGTEIGPDGNVNVGNYG